MVEEAFEEEQELEQTIENTTASEEDPNTKLVFNAAKVKEWLTKAYKRKTHVYDSALIRYRAFPGNQFMFLFELAVRSVKPGGLLYVPRDFPIEIIDTYEEVEDKSTQKYFALRVPKRLK